MLMTPDFAEFHIMQGTTSLGTGRNTLLNIYIFYRKTHEAIKEEIRDDITW